MKKRRKAWLLLAILAIVFPYFNLSTTVFPSQAEAVTETQQVIFEKESYGKVEVSYAEKETMIEWKISYQKYQDTSTNDEVQRVVKLKLEQVANGIGTVKNMNDLDLMEKENSWYSEKNFSSESEGSLIVEMPKEVIELVVEVQMDEQRVANQTVETEILTYEKNPTVETEGVKTIVEENVLPTEYAGPHTIIALSEVAVTEEYSEYSEIIDEQKQQSTKETARSVEGQSSVWKRFRDHP